LVRGGHDVINISRGQRSSYLDDPTWQQVRHVAADREAEDRDGTFPGRVAAMRPDVVVDLICAYNDDVALAVLAGMAVHHLTAPTDLAVIGVDNVPTAALASPPLTTVDFHPAAIGRHLAAIVLGEQNEPPDVLASPVLVVRESA
jgi:DNA-binding LacI/PurR family transcriptional regulator